MDAEREPDHVTPRWQRRPEARAEELVDAAVEVFGEVGFAKAKLEDVARRAGVSKGTVYLYFASKEALFQEMVRQKIGQHFPEGDALVADRNATSRELLARFIHRWWDIARCASMSRISRIIHSEIGNFPELARFFVSEVILRNRRTIRAIYEAGVARGEFRTVPNDTAIRSIASLIVHGAMYQRFFGPHDPEALTDDQVVEGILDLVFNGIAAVRQP